MNNVEVVAAVILRDAKETKDRAWVLEAMRHG